MNVKRTPDQGRGRATGRAVAGVLLLASILLLSCHAAAWSATATGGSDHVAVALVAERAAIRPGEPFEVGLHMKMRNGWHTYWKNPGDAGLPLRIEWSLPAGFTAGPIEWPAPERIETGEIMSYGYEREVLLAVAITPPAALAADSITIGGTFDWLECKDVCVSGSAELSLTLPARSEPAGLGPAAPLFKEARARGPRRPEGWSLAARAGRRAIELSFRPPPGVSPRGGYFFIDQPLVVEHAAAQGFERLGDGFRLTMVPAENAASVPSRITGVLVLDGSSRRAGSALAIDVEATPGDPAPAAAQATRARTSGWIYGLLIALAGLAIVLALRRRAPRP